MAEITNDGASIFLAQIKRGEYPGFTLNETEQLVRGWLRYREALEILEGYYWVGSVKQGQKRDKENAKFLKKCGRLPSDVPDGEGK